MRFGASAISAGVAAGLVPPAFLAAEFAHAKPATVQSFKLGDIEFTVISDGHLVLPARLSATGVPEAELKAALAEAGQTGNMVQPPANVTLIRSGSDTILVDTGAGPNFMATTGKLLNNMEAAGIDPASINKVVFTHGHPDHLWGALDDFEEGPRFAEATHYVAAAEMDFWMSENAEKGLPADRATFVTAARRNLKGIAEKTERIKAGDEIVTGIAVISTPGHTQGHISLEINAGGETLIVLGDALIHPVISFAHPDWRPAADHEPEVAIETRKKLLDRLASEKIRVLGYHLPFPGTGRVERDGSAYRFVSGV